MDTYEAFMLAEVLYDGRKDKSGRPEIQHVLNVCSKVQPDAKVVALLHDVFEDELASFTVLGKYLTSTQYKALWLLTRQEGVKYMRYIEIIAAAEGEEGRIAREVKLADNYENRTRPSVPSKEKMRLPGGRYDKARKCLKGEPWQQ